MNCHALLQRVSANVNCRMPPGVSPDVVCDELQRIVADPGVVVTRVDKYAASLASPLRVDIVDAYTRAVRRRRCSMCWEGWLGKRRRAMLWQPTTRRYAEVVNGRVRPRCMSSMPRMVVAAEAKLFSPGIGLALTSHCDGLVQSNKLFRYFDKRSFVSSARSRVNGLGSVRPCERRPCLRRRCATGCAGSRQFCPTHLQPGRGKPTHLGACHRFRPHANTWLREMKKRSSACRTLERSAECRPLTRSLVPARLRMRDKRRHSGSATDLYHHA